MTNDESNSKAGMTNVRNDVRYGSFEHWGVASFEPSDLISHSSFEFRHSDDDADSDLLAVAPRPALISLEELLLAIANAPRVIIRRVGVPVAALFAVAFAICLHLAILGVFIFGTRFGFFHSKGHGNALGDEGASGVGYVFLGEGGPEAPSSLANLAASLHTTEELRSVVPPKLPIVFTSPTSDAVEELVTKAAEPEIIGIASVAPRSITGIPKPRIPTAPSVQTLVVAPPSSDAGGTGGSGSGGDPEGSPLALLNGTGVGSGRGNKTGDGINRGESGANNPNPSVLDAPQVQLPDEFLFNPPKQSAKFEVLVLTNGRPGTITLLQSCGNKDIDTLCAATIRRYKFRPAYLAGKPIEKTMEITQNFTNN